LNRPERFRFWLFVTLLAGTGSLAAARLATPLSVDEKGTAFLLFFVLPAVPILLFGAVRRWAGTIVAALLPFLWLYLSLEGSDGVLLWIIPVAAGAAIVWAARASSSTRVPSSMAAFAAIVLGTGALLWPGPARPSEGPRVLLVGIDGATWDRIDPLLDSGKLPCIERLLENGRRAKLRSLPSMYSPQVWTTIATGCLPDNHGIEDFSNKQDDLQVGRIWDRLYSEGRSFGTYAWYFTWPPFADLGDHDFVVPSYLVPQPESFPPQYNFVVESRMCKPVRSRGRLLSLKIAVNAFRYGVRISTLRRAFLEAIDNLVWNRPVQERTWRNWRFDVALKADLFAELIRTRQPEFAAILFTEVDRVSHFHWEPPHPGESPKTESSGETLYGYPVDAVYAETDRSLEKILDSAPREVNLLVVSDHGFQPTRRTMAGKFCRINVTNLIEALGVADRLSGRNIDPRIYLRPKSLSPEERSRLLDQVEPILAAVCAADSGIPLFEIKREGGGLWLILNPRNTISEDARIVLSGKEYPFEEFVEASEIPAWSGVHHPDGVYLLAGPSAARSVSTESLHVVDVAPTLATLLQLPVSPMWTGRSAVRPPQSSQREVLEYPPPARSAKAFDRNDEAYQKMLEDKLRAIGYLK